MNRHIVMMKLPITSCPQLRPSESSKEFHGRMFKLNAKFDADFLLYLLSHLECDDLTVHMLTQWCLPPALTSTVKSSFSHMLIPVLSPWLPGYIDVVQDILVILTMAALLPGKLQTSSYIYLNSKLCVYRVGMATFLSSVNVSRFKYDNVCDVLIIAFDIIAFKTFTQWNSTQQRERRSLYPLQQHGWNWRALC